jgi:hypothetical protein
MQVAPLSDCHPGWRVSASPGPINEDGEELSAGRSRSQPWAIIGPGLAADAANRDDNLMAGEGRGAGYG